MEDLEFIEWYPTPAIQNQDGVAMIALDTKSFGKIMLGFKVVRKKDGSGRFITNPSWKLEIDGEERWMDWMGLDSNIAKEKIYNFIRENVKARMVKKNQQPSQELRQAKQLQPDLVGGLDDDDVPF